MRINERAAIVKRERRAMKEEGYDEDDEEEEEEEDEEGDEEGDEALLPLE